jgi:two-component system sensor histidine kinase PilS (NtrC family)
VRQEGGVVVTTAVQRVDLPPARGMRDTFWRSLQTFGITRVVITALLLLYLSYSTGKDARTLDAIITWEAGAVYLALAVLFALLSLYARQRFMLQLLAQLSVDIAVISKLYIAAGGASSGLAILYLFPLAGCAILAPMILALFVVSLVTLVLLGESGYQVLFSASAASTSTSQAGLYGAAFFAAAFTINRLAARLIKEEDLAARRGRDLHLQEAINRLVVADMGDGVLVVGPDTEVFACNPAVERMLGMPLSADLRVRLVDLPALAPIADAFRTWQLAARADTTDTGEADSGATSFVRIKAGFGSGPGDRRTGRASELAAHLQLRFAKVDAAGLAGDRAVIFMRDVSEIENQAQQLKLASMGRLTASIAHEVRNPLSAISHAASLLREEVSEPTQARLLGIVGENVVRLDRMIEDILKLSRKAQVHEEPLKLGPALQEIVGEFRAGNGLNPGLIEVGNMQAYQVRFDPLHLREVLVNLLSNGLRYASGADGSIRIHARAPAPGLLELHVQDDGVAITPQVRAHLFEPFYTTSSKGTGLGLYVARELCLNNGAVLDYEYRSEPIHGRPGDPSGRFVITFALERAHKN